MGNKPRRRQFLTVTTAALVSSVCVLDSFTRAFADTKSDKSSLGLTPSQSEGPFYPLSDQADKDTDLSHIEGRTEPARGQRISIFGRVTDESGSVITNAQVEIWQANAAGRYQHKRDRNRSALDPNFQGWGISRSSTQGKYKFTTILPGAYPASKDWTRPPHVHFKVSKPGYRQLITQMYFPGQDLNASDLILNSLSNQQLPLLIAKKKTGKSESPHQQFMFNIVLQQLG